ncbi:BURP domain-containing protein BNM2A-like [Pistacia vera]|uniref:BURP domain-containing protein BNM2A-like n=1 Tax=Pistacia vera TaxID=55513 RepID=UPI0012635EB4|nr:BURP domain-containing protein BNM2A-like [Pistacia vera]
MKMGLCSASWKVLLLLLVCVCRSGARKMKEESWKELGDNHQQNRKVPDESDYPVVDHHKIHPKEAIDPSSHTDHIDPSVRLFFKMNDLKLANIIPTYLPETDPSNSPHLFSREEADTIPFSLKDLPYLLDSFSYTHDSPQAKAMEDALRMCETNDHLNEELKFCATSLESMLDFARSVFGLKTDFEVLSTTHLIKSAATFQNYTILEEPKEISSPKMVA